MFCNLVCYRFNGFTPAIAGKGIAVSGVDDQRPRTPLFQIVAAQLHLGRATQVACRYAGNGCSSVHFNIGQVATIPFLVTRPCHALFDAGDVGHVGKG